MPLVVALASAAPQKSLGLGGLGVTASAIGFLGLRGGYNPGDRVLYLLGLMVLATFALGFLLAVVL